VEGGWRPGIGDPTFLGWFTVAAYLLGAVVCWKAARAQSRSGGRSLALPWIIFGLFLLVLGINKQLDLQTWFTIVGKQFAKSTGWYEQRRIVQFAFVGVIALGGLIVAILGLWWTRRLPVPYRIAMAGAIFLGGFIVIRASSFHHVDQFLGFQLAGLRVNVLLELGGIACITAAAWHVSKRKELQNGSRFANLKGFKTYG
jgi:hypothetical protein